MWGSFTGPLFSETEIVVKTKAMKDFQYKGFFKVGKIQEKEIPLEESSETGVIQKFLYRDLVRNHGLPLSRARLVVDIMFRVYDTLTAASTVGVTFLSRIAGRLDNFVDVLQNEVNRKGGEFGSEE